MPANKYALLRYRIIDRCLTNTGKPFPSREDLRNACEEALYGSGSSAISLSTIDKDIWAMKNEGELGYYAPITYSRENGGYFYSDASYTINELSLGDEDLEAIRFAAAILDQFREVPILRQYESAIEKIINRVNISPHPDDAHLDRFIQFEKSTISRGNEYLGPLLEAIRNRKEVELSYRSFRDESVKHYIIHPLLLKEYSNRWYLISYAPDRKTNLTFGLERIEQCIITKRKFEAVKDFDAERFFKYSIGITESKEKPKEVVLAFDPVPGKLLKTQPVHSSQRIISENENEICISLEVMPTMELLSFILSYGREVKVLKPSSLAEKVTDIYREAMGLYTSGGTEKTR